MGIVNHIKANAALSLPKFSSELQQRIKPSNTLIIIGDSITANNWGSSGVTIYNDSRGHWVQAQIKLNQRFTLLDNKGTAGETSTQIAARFATDVIGNANGKPDWVAILCGTNDVSGTDDTIANLRSMYQAAANAGIRVIACTIMPRDFAIYASQAKLLQFQRANTWIREYARSKPNVVLCDFASAMLDTTGTLSNSAKFMPVTGYFSDNLHPNSTGAQIMATVIYNQLNTIVPPVPLVMEAPNDGTNGNTDNPIRNGVFIQGTGGTFTGGGASGTLAQNWNCARSGGAITAVCSLVACTDGVVGNWQRIALSASTAISEQIILKQTPALTPVAVGDTVYAEIEVNASASAGVIQSCELQLGVWNAGFTQLIISDDNHAGNNDLNATTFAGTLRTRSFVMPATSNQFFYQFMCGTSVGGTANVDVRRARIVKVPTL